MVWLSMSRGFRGTRKAYENAQFNLCQLPPDTQLCGIGVDFNEVNEQLNDMGDFTIDDDADSTSGATAGLGQAYKVIARRGLRLREGPGTQFDIIDGLRSGQQVFVTSIEDGWACVDVDGDGLVDGFASAALLVPV